MWERSGVMAAQIRSSKAAAQARSSRAVARAIISEATAPTRSSWEVLLRLF
jgi:hypothetical protein